MARSSSPRTTAKKTVTPRRLATTASGTAQPDRPAGNGAPTREAIQRRAYEIYLSRGAEPGADVEDWLQAERELTAWGPGGTI